MEISPRELRDVEIRESIRGYHRDEVNDLLERAAATIEASNERIQQLTDRLSSAQSEAGRTRETEDVLHRTLLLAQRAADEAVAEATAKARQMLDDADIQSRRLVAEGEAEARRKGESERRRLEEEILDLAGRRDSLLADVEALTRFEAEYRERMVRALEADLFALRSRPTTAPGTRPEPSDVEMPSANDARSGPATDTNASASGSAPASSSAAPPAPVSAPPSASPSAPSSSPSPSPSSSPMPDREPARASATLQTHEVDVRTLFEQSKAAAAAASAATTTGSSTAGSSPAGSSTASPPATAAPNAAPAPPATPPPAPERSATKPPASKPPAPAAPGPIDLLGNDGGDADVLDDDAFFATLRDAVHDDAPLGPRDDDGSDQTFFDQDADRGSFRDVFRRRR